MAPPEPVNLATDILSKKTKKDKIHSHNDSQPISLGDRQKKKKRDDKSKAVLPPEDETLVNVEKRKRDDGEAAKVATSSRRKTLKANCNKNSLLPEPTTASLDVKDRPDVREGMPRKRKREEGIVQAENSDRKKDKKRRLECNEETGLVTAATTFDKPHKSKKNKRKNKTGFPDPDDDDSLSEQSKKSLVYAFSQFRRPGKWKFNKARQNWLIRNIWSSEMIPEIYFALVVTYLAKVQGRVRDNLIQVCRANSQPPITDGDETTPPKTDVSVAGSPSISPLPPQDMDNKKSRAQALLDVLNSPEESLA